MLTSEPELMLTVRAATRVASFPQWGDVPTWVTAGVAFFALIAAIAAYSKQAAAVNKLSKQIDVQSEQLKDQQEANRKQAIVLDAELSEFRERARLVERQQANAVDLKVENEYHLPQEPAIRVARVFNGSNRPIRNVRCFVRVGQEQKPHRMLWVKELADQGAGSWAALGQEEGDTALVIRPSARHGFHYVIEHSSRPWLWVTLRFTDDAGLHWQIDEDLHLEKLANRDHG